MLVMKDPDGHAQQLESDAPKRPHQNVQQRMTRFDPEQVIQIKEKKTEWPIHHMGEKVHNFKTGSIINVIKANRQHT